MLAPKEMVLKILAIIMFWDSAEAVVIAFCCKAYNYIVQKLPITRSTIFTE